MFLHWFSERESTSLSSSFCTSIPHLSPSSLSFCNLLGVLCLSLAELDAEHAQKVLEMEHAQQVKLKERQKYFEEAFQQDMEQYLSTGYLQITDRRGQLPIFFKDHFCTYLFKCLKLICNALNNPFTIRIYSPHVVQCVFSG